MYFACCTNIIYIFLGTHRTGASLFQRVFKWCSLGLHLLQSQHCGYSYSTYSLSLCLKLTCKEEKQTLKHYLVYDTLKHFSPLNTLFRLNLNSATPGMFSLPSLLLSEDLRESWELWVSTEVTTKSLAWWTGFESCLNLVLMIF